MCKDLCLKLIDLILQLIEPYICILQYIVNRTFVYYIKPSVLGLQQAFSCSLAVAAICSIWVIGEKERYNILHRESKIKGVIRELTHIIIFDVIIITIIVISSSNSISIIDTNSSSSGGSGHIRIINISIGGGAISISICFSYTQTYMGSIDVYILVNSGCSAKVAGVVYAINVGISVFMALTYVISI